MVPLVKDEKAQSWKDNHVQTSVHEIRSFYLLSGLTSNRQLNDSVDHCQKRELAANITYSALF